MDLSPGTRSRPERPCALREIKGSEEELLCMAVRYTIAALPATVLIGF
jgi:hypothetical protein